MLHRIHRYSAFWLLIPALVSVFLASSTNPTLTRLTLRFAPSQAMNYYVDSTDGSDENPGDSPLLPWQTFAPLEDHDFAPGNVIHLRRGSSWSNGLTIHSSGVEGKPVSVTAYGEGNPPLIRNSDQWTGIYINADWVVLDGVLVQNTYQYGIYISGDHNLVQNSEATAVGVGIGIAGQSNRVSDNSFHDLHMVVNTPGGDDDYGAIGIVLLGSDNEISYNRLVNCIADSYDWGTDGGAIEFDGSYGGVNNNFVHHNFATGDAGFLEIGRGPAWDNVLAYNVSTNNTSTGAGFSFLNLSGPYASDVRNLRIENNTIVETAGPPDRWAVFGFDEPPAAGVFTLRNNIVSVDGLTAISNQANFSHDHNLFQLISPSTELGFTLGPGELVADPKFVNPARQDYHLQAGSPAIGMGDDLGYHLDYDNAPVPRGSQADLGAFEYLRSLPEIMRFMRK